MSKLSARFIDELGECVIKDFAPSITEGQYCTAYLGEEMTPYSILGENISVNIDTPSGNTLIQENHIVNAAEALAESFTLENNIAFGTENKISLSVCGIAQTVNVDFSVSGNIISWSNKALHNIGLTEGDIFSISYYQEIE